MNVNVIKSKKKKNLKSKVLIEKTLDILSL